MATETAILVAAAMVPKAAPTVAEAAPTAAEVVPTAAEVAAYAAAEGSTQAQTSNYRNFWRQKSNDLASVYL